MKVYAKAKINLGLWIQGKYADGYHKLETLLFPIDLWDEIEIIKHPSFQIIGPNFGKDDYLYKAYKKLEVYCNQALPVKVTIEKNIPIGAGLAGGTADGAALLKALKDLYNLDISQEDLQDLSKDLGVDFSYCLYNKPALGKGRGDDLAFIGPYPSVDCLIINPGYSISTKDAYSWIESFSSKGPSQEIFSLLDQKDYKGLRKYVVNDLEAGVSKRHREIREMKEALYSLGADFASMSGSGPSVYGLFSSRESFLRAYESLRDSYPILVKTRLLGGRDIE